MLHPICARRLIMSAKVLMDAAGWSTRASSSEERALVMPSPGTTRVELTQSFREALLSLAVAAMCFRSRLERNSAEAVALARYLGYQL